MAFGDITNFLESVEKSKAKKKADRLAVKLTQKEAELEERNKFNLKIGAMSPADLTEEFDLPF